MLMLSYRSDAGAVLRSNRSNWGNWASWAYSGMDWGNKGGSLGSQVLSTGSNNISRFSWDNGTIGVGNKCWGKWVSGISWVTSITVTSICTPWVSTSIETSTIGTVWVSS